MEIGWVGLWVWVWCGVWHVCVSGLDRHLFHIVLELAACSVHADAASSTCLCRYTPGGSFQFCLHRPSTAPKALSSSPTTLISSKHSTSTQTLWGESGGVSSGAHSLSVQSRSLGPAEATEHSGNRVRSDSTCLGGGFPGNCPQVCVVELMVWDLGRVCVHGFGPCPFCCPLAASSPPSRFLCL